MKIIYSMYRAGEVSVHRVCCERATQHTLLVGEGGGGEATIYPGSRPEVDNNAPGGISGMKLVQVCRWASSYPPYKCILEYRKGIPINVYTIMTGALQSVSFMHIVHLVFKFA